MREAKALILRLEQEKKVALQDMMDNLQLALREKDEAVKNMSDSRQVLEERSVQLEEMKKEKDEFFHKMEKQLEESEKRLEIAEVKKEREESIFPPNKPLSPGRLKFRAYACLASGNIEGRGETKLTVSLGASH